MPLVRKRRADAEPSPSPPAQRARSSEAESPAAEVASADETPEGEDGFSANSQELMVKKLVRLALASEHSRQPIRRSDISTKVLAPASSRAFKDVFGAAQTQLMHVFGLQLVELPSKERVTIQQKRAAQRAEAEKARPKRRTDDGEGEGGREGGAASAGTQTQTLGSSQNKAWVLASTLPPSLRRREILPPPKAPSLQAEAAYMGLCSFLVSVIYLSDGSRVSERKLEAYLKTCNVGDTVLAREKTDVVLKRMERQGYIVKVKERDGAGGEETVDYVVGPRGKVEIGEKGVAGMVRSVYGKTGNEMEELEDRLETSLGPGTFRRKTKKPGEQDGEEEAGRATGAEDGAEQDQAVAQQRGNGHSEVQYSRRSTRGRPAASDAD